ncbi:MAG: hypothetical protein WCD88_08185 [Desulfobacterales bacterium]
MMRRFARLFFSIPLILAFIAQFMTAPPSHAYVLHGYHLLDLMRREMGSARSLQVVQDLSIQPGTLSPDDGRTVQETLSYRFPTAFRSEFTAADGEHIRVFSNGRSVTVVDRRIVSDAEGELDRFKDIFLYNTRDLLKKRLAELGVAAASYPSSPGRSASASRVDCSEVIDLS